MLEVDFINCPCSTQMQILNKIQIRGTFQLTSTFYLVGFKRTFNNLLTRLSLLYSMLICMFFSFAVLASPSTSPTVDQPSCSIKQTINLPDKISSKCKPIWFLLATVTLLSCSCQYYYYCCSLYIVVMKLLLLLLLSYCYCCCQIVVVAIKLLFIFSYYCCYCHKVVVCRAPK